MVIALRGEAIVLAAIIYYTLKFKVLEYKLLDRISKPFNDELPHAESLDDYLDEIIPKVRPWGEDLSEVEFYLEKPWLEFRDDESFHDKILHIFKEGGEYIKSKNGGIGSGGWEFYDKANKFMINDSDDEDFDGELYDLAFLDDQFFILQKHGDQPKLGHRKYFVMVHEPDSGDLEWREIVEKLFFKYRNSNRFYVSIAIIIVLVIAIILALS